jgi:phage-related protein
VAVNNPGNAPLCSQWHLTIVASSATVVVNNADDTEPPLVLAGITPGHTIVVDGAGRSVTDNGASAPSRVAAGSGWPALVPGVNDFTVTGGTGTFTFTPLYL